MAPDDLAGCLKNNSCEKADVAVVVSGGDTNARVDEAVRLYKDGIVQKILVSGAAADKNAPSNAQAMRDYALSSGIPLGDIVLENRAANTHENADFSKEIIEDRGWRRVILVTSAYHQRRASMEFERALGGKVELQNHPTSHDKAWGPVWWLTPVGWWLALSELTGMVLFNVR